MGVECIYQERLRAKDQDHNELQVTVHRYDGDDDFAPTLFRVSAEAIDHDGAVAYTLQATVDEGLNGADAKFIRQGIALYDSLSVGWAKRKAPEPVEVP